MMTTQSSQLSELTAAQIVEAASAAGEPAWMVERREAAWQAYSASEAPFWRRTDLTKLQTDTLMVPSAVQSTNLVWDASLAAQGVVFTTLAQALRDHPELVQKYFGTAIADEHRYRMLHSALWQDGAFLYVPKNVMIETPLRAVYSLADGSQSTFPHTIVVLERGASASFIEEYSSADQPNQVLCAPASEIFIGDGASLRYVALQAWGNGVYHIGAQRVMFGRDANCDWVALNLGATLQHLETESNLLGDGSKVNWVAAILANGTQVLLNAPWLRHSGTNTEGHMDFKTVVKDSGYTTFDGMIKIDHESRGTITRLEEHALHLSPKARSDSIPGLKIDTNDVAQAGHASTSGEVDDEQLFYMLSRGIPRAEAVHMIVTGFFEPVIDRIPDEALRERVAEMVEAKL
ncbi:MAG: Fe-S cluster assembly protein SufD [Roseiflexaceae bacterium]|nr:Fe-S cluster assembly protein SufD [Roseiflexaceae bacterium]